MPRGRVYANYASRCATERITVLNPASFGKLVRVLFPGLKTRRLGVRGESKYHYVNFALVDDQPDLRDSQPPVPRPLPEAKSLSQNFKYVIVPERTRTPRSGPNLRELAHPFRATLPAKVHCLLLRKPARAGKAQTKSNSLASSTVCTTNPIWPASTTFGIRRPKQSLSSHFYLPTTTLLIRMTFLHFQLLNYIYLREQILTPPSHYQLCIVHIVHH